MRGPGVGVPRKCPESHSPILTLGIQPEPPLLWPAPTLPSQRQTFIAGPSAWSWAGRWSMESRCCGA